MPKTVEERLEALEKLAELICQRLLQSFPTAEADFESLAAIEKAVAEFRKR